MGKKNNFKIVWDFMKNSRLSFAVCILTHALVSLCDMINPQIVRATIDNALGGKEADFPEYVMKLVEHFGGFSYIGKHLWIMAVALLIVSIMRSILSYFSTVANNDAAESLSLTMRNELFEHIQKLPYEWHMANKTGDIIQRCTSDIQTVRNFIAEQLRSLLLVSVKLVLGFYFMFSMNLKLALYAIIPIPFIIYFTVKFSKDMHNAFHACDEMEGVVSSMVQENLTGVRVIRAFGQEKKERDRFVDQNEKYTNLWIKAGYLMGRFWVSQDVFTGLQTLLVLCLGAKMCVDGQMLAGEYIAFLSYNAMLSAPIRRLGRTVSEMSKAGVSVGRIAYIVNSEEEKDRADAIEADMNTDIHFDHVTYSYDGVNKVLDDVTFDIKAGSTLGILGGTGSGKSTLMLLLDKMYTLDDGQGSIKFGDVNINDIKTSYLRDNISIVLQEPFLYSRTIAQNISIGDDEMSIDDIKKAAKSACLDETVEGFAKGYDTTVGERGVTLSGGQKQRTAIARALTKDVPVYIFDDSLSAVDTQTDAKIRDALEKRFGSATIIIISHRVTTLSKVDNILVLDDSKVSEFGTPDKLKTSGGLYNKIYDIQAGLEVSDEE